MLRFIADSIRRAIAAKKEVSVCGEMAGRADLAPFFIGLGCRRLSMDSSHIPSLKERIRSLTLEECEEFARSLVRRKTVESVRRAVEEFAHHDLKTEDVQND